VQRCYERGTEEDQGGGRVGDPETGVSCAEARWADRAGAGTEEGRGRGGAAIRHNSDSTRAAETDVRGRGGIIALGFGNVVPYVYLWVKHVVEGCVYTRKSSSQRRKCQTSRKCMPWQLVRKAEGRFKAVMTVARGQTINVEIVSCLTSTSLHRHRTFGYEEVARPTKEALEPTRDDSHVLDPSSTPSSRRGDAHYIIKHW
jgi:hypothetical protein